MPQKTLLSPQFFPESLFCPGHPRKAAESSLRQVKPTRFGNLLVFAVASFEEVIRLYQGHDGRLHEISIDYHQIGLLNPFQLLLCCSSAATVKSTMPSMPSAYLSSAHREWSKSELDPHHGRHKAKKQDHGRNLDILGPRIHS